MEGLSLSGGSRASFRRRAGDTERAVIVMFDSTGGWARSVIKVPLSRLSERQRSEEAAALNVVYADAVNAGARVPTVRLAPLPDGLPALRFDAIPGHLASNLLGKRPARLPEIMEQLVSWLERWGLRSRRLAYADADRLNREILAPAAALASTLDVGREYLGWLRARVDTALGEVLPFVAAHNDLSMTNVLFDGTSRPGVIDWERATPSGLPLTDYFYAAADALAATQAYRRRAHAFRIAFDPSTNHGRLVDRHARRLAKTLDLSVSMTELLMHATLLHHAANEQARNRTDSRPFGEALEWLARRALSISAER
jgi:hypothetical protein